MQPEFTPAAFKQHMKQFSETPFDYSDDLLMIRTADECIESAKTKEIPKMLFDSFWIETELCILFADTNVGKSILAVQIANSIAKGIPIPGFKMEAPVQPIIYCDFELSDKQFENRYSENYNNHYVFGPNFYRTQEKPDKNPELSVEDHLISRLEGQILRTGCRILIIDNITYLKTDTEKAADALPLMRRLNTLKGQYNLSILVLAHTPKRDGTRPITLNDLQGSKMLMNFCDSSFAVGQSRADKSLRYIKQIKVRHASLQFDDGNVAVCSIGKPANFLQFEYLHNAFEREHLKVETEDAYNELKAKVLELSKTHPNLPALAISRHLCPETAKLPSFNVKISRIIKRLKAAGEL